MAEKQGEATRREERALARREPLESLSGPFAMLDRFAAEMDHVFGEFGLGRGWFGPRLGFRWPRPLLGRADVWHPDIEMLQRNNHLVIRADLPGLAKDDIKVELAEDAVTIEGERRQEVEEENVGVYRAERSYGSFRRVIALPQGALTDQAKASFKDGVLEITMPAPPETVTRGRRLEITASASPKK
jgi:HSP20 family protein